MVVSLSGLHEEVLPRVSRPNQYIAPFSIPEKSEGRICLLYPGPHRRAFANPAFCTFMEALRTQARDVAVDVVVRPERDLDELLSSVGLQLFGMASHLPLGRFDCVLVFAGQATEIPQALRMLRKGGISPIRATRSGPRVILCGSLSLWGEAFGSFFDAVLAGDPETFVDAILSGSLVGGEGVWTPGGDSPVKARWLSRFAPVRQDPNVSLCELEPGGIPLEVARVRGVADAYYAPEVLFRDSENAIRATESLLSCTGFDRVVWGGFYAAWHPDLTLSLEHVHRRVYSQRQTVRVEWVDPGRFPPGLAREIHKGRRGTLKFLPLALSERLRDAGGSPLSRDHLLRSLELAGRGGWQAVEMTVLAGVPEETEADRREFESFLDTLTTPKIRRLLPKLRVTLDPYAPKPRLGSSGATPISPSQFGSWARALREQFKKTSRLKIAEGDAGRAQDTYRLLRGDEVALKSLGAFAGAEGFVDEPFSTGWQEGESDARQAGAIICVGELPQIVREEVSLSGESGLLPRTNGRRVRRGTPKRADRYRIRYRKTIPLRFASHLEIIRALERGFIGAQIPLSWSQGKDPKPKIAFGPPLAVGMTSEAEYLDVTLSREIGESFLEGVNQRLPRGLLLSQCLPIRNEAASLGSSIDVASYRVSFPERFKEDNSSSEKLRERLEVRVHSLLASESILMTKTKKEKTLTYNARPSILTIQVVSDGTGYPAFDLRIRLNRPESTRPQLLARYICDAIDVDERTLHVHRTGLLISGGERDLDPMQVIQSDFAWWRESLRGGVVK